MKLSGRDSSLSGFRSQRLPSQSVNASLKPASRSLPPKPTVLPFHHVNNCHTFSGCRSIDRYQRKRAATQNYCTVTRTKRALPLVQNSQTDASDGTHDHIQVVLTREAGKNGKLMKLLESKGISCLEMPLVETAAGPDADRLPEVLKREADSFDWVCITSPEAATVFTKGWIKAGRPEVRIAVVGEGTARVLRATGESLLAPSFVPSVANADHFGPELPFRENGTKRVLYPASNKASSILQEGLRARGFDVVRLNTYDTLPVKSLEPDVLHQAQAADVIAIASPSAVKAWIAFAGTEVAGRQAVACIGSTSGRAALKLGLAPSKIFYPEEPSLENFASSIIEALHCDVSSPAAAS